MYITDDLSKLITSKKSLLYGHTPIISRQVQINANQAVGIDRLNALLFTGNPVDYAQSQRGKTNDNRLRRLWKNRP